MAPDPEAAVYFYRRAVVKLNDGYHDRTAYPSLFLSLARAHMPGGLMNTDLKAACRFLQIARDGYGIQIAEGAHIYDEAYAETLRLLDDACFDSIRDEMEENDGYEALYGNNSDDDDDDEDCLPTQSPLFRVTGGGGY